MDRGLIALKFAMLRNTSAGLRRAGWVIGGALVLSTWVAVALATDGAVRHSVITLALALWLIGGMIGPVLMSGAGVLRADYFTLLPIPRFVLGRGLLATVFTGVAAAFVLLALLAVLWIAVPLGPLAIAVGLVGAILGWILVIVLSRLVYGLLGAAMRTRLGIEIAGVQWGILLAAMFAGWIVVAAAFQTVPELLRSGLPAGPITIVVDAIPSSWPVLAVEAAGAGDLGAAALWLGALLALNAVCLVATIALLVPRSTRVQRRSGRRRSASLVAGRGLLPSGPIGAVTMKELRQWRRDPWRALEASTAVWTGVAIGVFALLGGYTAPVGAFAGLIVALMVALAGMNLYGQDGTAVWQTVVGESAWSARADVRGRQWAMVLIFLPRALVVSGIFLVITEAWWSIPFIVASMPATIGAATGAAVLTSAIGVSPGVDPRRRVGPNDANGNVSLHFWIALLFVAIAVLPTVGAIIWAAVVPVWWVQALAALTGLANGLVAAAVLGSLAIAYLQSRMSDVFTRIRYARVFSEPATGFFAAVARVTLRGEIQYAEQKQKERERRLARTPS